MYSDGSIYVERTPGLRLSLSLVITQDRHEDSGSHSSDPHAGVG